MSDTPKQKTPQDLLDQIKYQVLPHSNCSQICQGIYPEGVTQDDVRRKVCGTFGGRFESFGGGHFRYIAYTD